MAIVRLDLNDIDVVEEIWALQHQAYRVEASLIGVSDLPPLHDTVQSLQMSDEIFIGYRKKDDTDDYDELRGAIAYETEKKGSYTLCKMMVHPNYMRQGIGRMLIHHFLSELPPNSYVAVNAEIRNLPAIALYTQLGFKKKTTYIPSPGITMLLLEYYSNNNSYYSET